MRARYYNSVGVSSFVADTLDCFGARILIELVGFGFTRFRTIYRTAATALATIGIFAAERPAMLMRPRATR